MDNLNLLNDNGAEVESSIINAYNALQKEAGEKELTESDPRTLFLKTLAYTFTCYSALINYNLKQNFLEFAEGDNLDNLGKITGTYRIQATKSLCTARFTRVAGSNNNILIPAKTKITADSVIYFETTKNAEIMAGENYVDVVCSAVVAGSNANGYGKGSITQIVDNIAYLKSVENITDSTGGTDLESDENFKNRIYIAPETFSVAGPKLAYIYHTKSVSSDIIDVAILSENPGEVSIYPLMNNGELPSDELLTEIKNKLSADDIRPLTDSVNVIKPVIKNYNINLDYYLYDNKNPINHDEIVSIVNKFIIWQKSAIGRDINTDKLISDLHNCGVKRVVIHEPVFTAVADNELAVCDEITVNYKGLEKE